MPGPFRIHSWRRRASRHSAFATGRRQVVCAVLLACYGAAPLLLPQPAPTSVAPDRFSAARALLILTHADSRSFGGGDNASGAAVLLEAARAAGIRIPTLCHHEALEQFRIS